MATRADRVRAGYRRAIFQAIISGGLLYIAWQTVGGGDVIAQFGVFHPLWAIAGVAVTIPQVILSAIRWRMTAARLGAELGIGRAIADYFLAGFVNQVLPSGVMGDALRAWRHGRRLPERETSRLGTAVRAVIYERTSGQAVMLAFVLGAAALWPLYAPGAEDLGWRIWGGLAAFIASAAVVLVLLQRLHGGYFDHVRRAGGELLYAVFHPEVIAPQLGMSILIAASYIVVFYCAAQAIDVALQWQVALLIVPAVLLSMAIPISIAGWGVREGVAAILWAAVGLSPAQGIAVSIAYGVLVLAASLPGALVLASGR